MLKYNFLALERSVFVNSAVFTGTDEDAILKIGRASCRERV